MIFVSVGPHTFDPVMQFKELNLGNSAEEEMEKNYFFKYVQIENEMVLNEIFVCIDCETAITEVQKSVSRQMCMKRKSVFLN